MPIEVTDSTVTLVHPNGASATVLLYGATVISWKSPGQGSDDLSATERLFVSKKAALDGTKPVRGGIPIVFPFFGPPTRPEHMHLAQHGFARSATWRVGATVLDSDAGVSVRFELGPSAALDPDGGWALAYTVTLAAHQLSTDLLVRNGGAAPLPFQALLHTYHAAPAANVGIAPLTGLTLVDKVRGGAERVEERDKVNVGAFTDSVYKDAGGAYVLRWPGGGADVRTMGFKDVVVWNPAAEAGAKMGDMEDGGWERFVCVEPGTIASWVELAPGQEWRGLQIITAL